MLEVIFYRTDAGNEPALDWFRALEPEERRIVGFDLRVLQLGFPMGMPLCKSLDGQRFIVVHGFTKKSQKTPKGELDTAKARKKLYKS